MKPADFERLIAPYADQVGLVVSEGETTISAHHVNEAFPAASIIKLAVLATLLADGTDFNAKIRFNDSAIVGGAGVVQQLSWREYSIRDLASLMISVSDNTAANILIDAVGMAHINAFLTENGYEQTHLNRLLMDTAPLSAGIDNWVSAQDAHRLLTQVLGSSNEVQSWFYNQQFRYKLPGLFDELETGVLVANKTGESTQIDHDVARFEYGNRIVTVAVLTKNFTNRGQALALLQDIGAVIWHDLTN